MYTVNKKVSEVLGILTTGLTPGEARTLNNAPGAFMALHIECLAPRRFSVAHYASIQGDLVPDPDVEFWQAPTGTWVPLCIAQVTGHVSIAVEMDGDRPVRWHARGLQELVQFCDLWLGENVSDQQGGLAAIRAACAQQSA